ncbi:MAG: hypothetical protein ACQESR_05315 [Planctomycetota bacterium]
MAHANHVVGIIRLDATSKQNAPFEADIGQTLHRLRAGPPVLSDMDFNANSPRICSRRRIGNRISGTWDDATVVLTADLRQLARDLEAEWTKYQQPATCHGWSDVNEFEM